MRPVVSENEIRVGYAPTAMAFWSHGGVFAGSVHPASRAEPPPPGGTKVPSTGWKHCRKIIEGALALLAVHLLPDRLPRADLGKQDVK